MIVPWPLLTPSGQHMGHLLGRKRLSHAAQGKRRLMTTARAAQKMRCLGPASKLWCKKEPEVMRHEAQVSSIPALKTSEGAWVLDAQKKANLFADTSAGRSKLPHLCQNSHTERVQSLEVQAAVACPTVEQCMAVLAGLWEDKLHQSRDME